MFIYYLFSGLMVCLVFQLSSPSSRVMVTVTHIPGPDGFHMDTMSQLSRCNNIKAGHVQQFMVDLKASGGEGYVVYQDAICLFAKETYEVEMTFQMMNSGGGSTLIDSVSCLLLRFILMLFYINTERISILGFISMLRLNVC